MEPVEILAKVLAELIRRLREHKLLTDADVLALTAILMEMAERGERKGEAAIKVPERNFEWETSVSRKR
jgi:hypothetical protein